MFHDTFNVIYPNDCAPIALSTLLRKWFIPRKWRHFLRVERQITVNGQYRSFNQTIYPGDKIQLCLTHVDSNQHCYPPSHHLPKVIYEDQNVLIIDKPKGQRTHPNLNETDTALNDCATYLGYSPFITHRLDMLTNGLLLVAKNAAVVPILNRQLATKELKRTYLAKVDLTCGHALKMTGTINLPIDQDPHDKRKRCIAASGLKAITHYRVCEYDNHQATLVVQLETGRTHQIRVHLASISLPIIGDPLYNANFNGKQTLQLTAFQLIWLNPFSFETKQAILPKFKDSKSVDIANAFEEVNY